MNALFLAFGLTLLTALGHSVLSERLFLKPLRAADAGAVNPATRLSTGMFHLASVFWVTMGVSLLLLSPAIPGERELLMIYASIFALCGVGNFWAVGRVHPGGVLLLCTSGLILFSLFAGSPIA